METQSQRKQKEKSREHAKQSSWVLKAGAVVAIVGGILLYRMMNNSQTPDVTELTAVSATTAEKQEIKLAYAAAKAAIEAPDWKGMQQHVLATDRVGPLMQWFYAKHPQGYQVRKVSGMDHEVIDLVHQPSTATLRLLTNDGVLHVLLQKTEQGWKLDWESFSNVYSVLWAAFLKGEPDLPKELPMPLEIETCPRSTLVPSWFTSTGIDPANIGRAVRLYIAHPPTWAWPVGMKITPQERILPPRWPPPSAR